MAFGFLSDFIKYTSDHTYQKASVETYSKTGQQLVLRGMTWNMLNRCHSKNAKYKFSNNPFDLDEVDVGYEKRKKVQLKFLAKEIESKSLDYIVLQEVDIFTGKNHPGFVSDFLIQLHDNNWGVVHSQPGDDLHMPLLILYDKSKLDLIVDESGPVKKSSRVIFPRDGDGKKCALEATFKDRGTGETVCVVNMHLDYNTDHSAAILEYQQQQIAAGKFTVIGGDANQQDLYPGLAGDKLIPSCITNPDSEPSSIGADQLQRKDGFMASPAHADATVTITEGVCGYFQWKQPNQIRTFLRNKADPAAIGKFVFKTLNPAKERLGGHVAHKSMPGAPFMSRPAAHIAMFQKN
jgi:endonuclease/exonuclease/phosphatase family metal-dependent hydrolase